MSVAGIHLREATVEDMDALLALERSIEDAPHWTEAAWRDVLASSGIGVGDEGMGIKRVVILALRDGEAAGFVVLGLTAGVAEMESVAVAPAHRRTGVARALCERGMGWARGRGAEEIELEVRASNEAALRLYGSLGFEEQARRRGYYREPVEDAVLMRKRLGAGYDEASRELDSGV